MYHIASNYPGVQMPLSNASTFTAVNAEPWWRMQNMGSRGSRTREEERNVLYESLRVARLQLRRVVRPGRVVTTKRCMLTYECDVCRRI